MNEMLQGLILAAGRGSRMKAETEKNPKCLVKLAEKTLLSYQLNALDSADIPISRTAIVAGYREADLSLPFAAKFINHEWQSSNMVRSMLCASSWLEQGTTILSYSDLVFSSAITRTLSQESPEEDLAIAFDVDWLKLWEKRFADPFSDAETFILDNSGYILEIGKRPQSLNEVQGQYMGLLRFNRPGWLKVKSYLDSLGKAEVDRLDMTTLLNQLISCNGAKIKAIPIKGGWYEVDSENDLAIYEAEIKAGRSWINPE